MARTLAPLEPFVLPEGPPLHLEQPGRIREFLEAFVRPERIRRLEEVLARRTHHLAVLLDRVHDPHNISACLRSCDACGIQRLHIIPADDADVTMHREVTQGTHRWLDITIHPDAQSATQALAAEGYVLAITDLHGSAPPLPLRTLPLDAPLCLVFGNEREGVSAEVRQVADLRFRIPMWGFVESLNISVAVGISLHLLRERVDTELGDAALLDPPQRTAALDRWLLEDVPRAHAVLEEVARRAHLSSTNSPE